MLVLHARLMGIGERSAREREREWQRDMDGDTNKTIYDTHIYRNKKEKMNKTMRHKAHIDKWGRVIIRKDGRRMEEERAWKDEKKGLNKKHTHAQTHS